MLRRIVLPAGDRVFGQRMMQRLALLEQAQWWDRDRILAYRDARLRELIETAYQDVAMFRELMDERHLQPADIRSATDLRKLPAITKTMLRSGYPQRVTRQTRQSTYEVSTSGSTGQSLHVREDAYTAGWTRATFLLMLEWAGWRLGERHLQTGMTLLRTRDRQLKDTLMRCHYMSAYDLRDEKLDQVLEVLDKYRVEHLWGYPGSLYYIARRATAMGWNRPLRSTVTWGDMLFPGYRDAIGRAFGTRVFDTFGCAEGVQIAGQCGVDGRYHVHNLDVIVEYVDGQGEPVQTGQPGALLLTRLHPGPTPLIRYQNGDVATGSGNGHCPCGRQLELMSSIQGRNTDVILTPSGNRLIVHFFTGIIEHYHEIDAFQVVQEQIDRAILRLVPAAGCTPQTIEHLLSNLRDHGAAELQFDVELVNDIPLTSAGKRRFVVSRLDDPSAPPTVGVN